MVFLPTFVPQIFGALSKNIHEVLVQPLFVSLKDFEVFGGTGFFANMGYRQFPRSVVSLWCKTQFQTNKDLQHIKKTREYQTKKHQRPKHSANMTVLAKPVFLGHRWWMHRFWRLAPTRFKFQSHGLFWPVPQTKGVTTKQKNCELMDEKYILFYITCCSLRFSFSTLFQKKC